jgi:hypothetical protein
MYCFSVKPEKLMTCSLVVSYCVRIVHLLYQATINALKSHVGANPSLGAEINEALMFRVHVTLLELKSLASKHQNSNMLTKFALARKTQSLLIEATQCFADATSKLQLNIAVAQYGVSLRIDEGVSVLLR